MMTTANPTPGTVINERKTPQGTIRKVVSRTAYPRNGNVDNPTVYYRWELWREGRLIDSSHRAKDLLQ